MAIRWRKQGDVLKLVRGFRSGGLACGIKPSGRPDLAVLAAEQPAVAVGCFTRNRAAAAPVLLSRKHLRAARHRAVVINSGNANCATGRSGMAHAERMAQLTADSLGCSKRAVLVCSTGVIGVQLPMPEIEAGIPRLIDELDAPPASAAEAILTTDLVSKQVGSRFESGYAIAGIGKGSGMIHPNMATMLGFVLTDAELERGSAQALLRRAVARSFNRISVDNDESTNDCVLLLASGASGKRPRGRELELFEERLTDCCQQLAQAIVRDGEGASTFIELRVSGARSEAEADRVAAAVADSMLVKTAFAGRDPNWGRIVSAAGSCGVPFRLDDLRLWLNGVLLFSGGMGHGSPERPFLARSGERPVSRKRLQASMRKGDQLLELSLGRGRGRATRWTSDLTHGYVTINAEYTT